MPSVRPLWRNVCLGCLPIFWLLLNYMSCLYILEIRPLLITLLANIFSQSIGFSFMVSFAMQKLVCWIRSPLFLLLLVSWETDLKKKNGYYLCQRMLCLCSSFMVSCLVVKPFYFCVSCGVFELHWFTCNCPAFPAPLVKEIVFPPLCILASSVEDWVCVDLLLDFLFSSTDLYVFFFFANTRLLWLL